MTKRAGHFSPPPAEERARRELVGEISRTGGSALDNFALMGGLLRTPGETDTVFRTRILTRLMDPSRLYGVYYDPPAHQVCDPPDPQPELPGISFDFMAALQEI